MEKALQEAYLKGMREGIDNMLANLATQSGRKTVKEQPQQAKADKVVAAQTTKVLKTTVKDAVTNKEAKKRIIKTLQNQPQGITLVALRDAAGLKHQIFWKALNILRRTELIKRSGRGVKRSPFIYFITTKVG